MLAQEIADRLGISLKDCDDICRGAIEYHSKTAAKQAETYYLWEIGSQHPGEEAVLKGQKPIR